MTRLADRVKEVTSTTGTSPKLLSGAVSGFRAFLATLGPGGVYYAEVHQSLAEWEVGIATLTASPDTLTASSILASSNAGAAVNFSAGLKDIFCTIPAVALATPIISKAFVSSAQTITLGSTLTLAHSLATIPTLMQLRVKCTTAEHGWSVGDEIVFAPSTDYFAQGAGATAINFASAVDATNILVLTGAAGVNYLHKTTRVIVTLTPGSWQLYVRAWA